MQAQALVPLIATSPDDAFKTSSSLKTEDGHWFAPHNCKLHTVKVDRHEVGAWTPDALFSTNEYIQVKNSYLHVLYSVIQKI